MVISVEVLVDQEPPQSEDLVNATQYHNSTLNHRQADYPEVLVDVRLRNLIFQFPLPLLVFYYFRIHFADLLSISIDV